MTRTPEAWRKLGHAIRADRERQGLTREELGLRARVTARSVYSLETGVVPKRRDKPPSLEPVAAALGWPRGAADRILNGEPADVALRAPREDGAPSADDGKQSKLAVEQALQELPRVFAFGRAIVELGGDPGRREAFDDAVAQLVASLPVAVAPKRGAFDLAAYRPHAEGDGVPSDDAVRIHEALRRDE